MAAGDYVKTTYINGQAPARNAANLNNHENKTKELDTDVAALKSGAMTIAGVKTFSSAPIAPGFKFPGTQVASTDPNTLDDYEEGTFSPVLQFGGLSAGITYSIQTGCYTKIGNRVSFNLYLSLSSKGTSFGSAGVTGLPFVSANISNTRHALSLRTGSVTFADAPFTLMGENSAVVQLYESTNSGISTPLADTDFTATSSLMISGQYNV